MRGLRVKRLVLCGVVGVVATVLSAWGVSVYHSFSGKVLTSVYTPEARWPIPVPENWPKPDETRTDSSLALRLETSSGYAQDAPGEGRYCVASRVQIGVPLRSVEMHVLRVARSIPNRVYYRTPVTRHSIEPPWLGNPQIGLPYRPVWPGFAVNAAFYAGVCWALLFAPGVVVRWRRRRRGRCAACGYDLSGLETCPECGGGR